MGIPVMVIGESGSGKSASMRNFKVGELGIINVSRKPLPSRANSNLSIATTTSKSKKSFAKRRPRALLLTMRNT